MAPDPFAALGLSPEATVAEVREARRRLAMEHHPDRGGDPERMRQVNEAADAALTLIAQRRPSSVAPSRGPSATSPVPAGDGRAPPDPSPVARDVPSFTVEAVPAETFEALVIVAATMGEVLDDDPPHRLDAYLAAPFECWCRLDVLPEAGASTISLTVAAIDDHPAPPIIAVRDAWVAALNHLDWPA